MSVMAEDQSAPRKTTTYKQFSGMNSQDERYGCEDTEFFWLENMMVIGDGKLKSIPGPGTAMFISTGGLLELDSNLGFVELDSNDGVVALNG